MILHDSLKPMKEQILPELPIVGKLKLSTNDGRKLSGITVVKGKSSAKLEPFFQQCYEEIKKFLNGETQKIDIPLDYSDLTPFQFRVLKEMEKIPYGKVATYKDLAKGLKTKGYQAIGTACGKNPFMLIYPCHRVLGSNDLGGFAHGLTMKKALLSLESGPDSLSLVTGKTK